MSPSRWRILLVVASVAGVLVALGVAQATVEPNAAPNTQPSPSRFADDGSESIQAAVTRQTLLWAVVNSDGSLARDKGARDANRIATGQYEVLFDQRVSNCAYVASIGIDTSQGSATPGEISTAARSGARNGVFVATQNSSGADASRSFHLAVFCPAR
jgi:hypothetical protein